MAFDPAAAVLTGRLFPFQFGDRGLRYRQPGVNDP